MTALQLLGPQTPMLFQGQEFGATTPFYYFADRDGELADMVRNGRREFLAQFLNLTDTDLLAGIPDPCSRETFESVKLDWSEWDRHGPIVAMHRDLLTLRREDVAFSAQPVAREGRLDGSVLSPSAFLLRFFSDRAEDERILLVNYGESLVIDSLPDPLLAPPGGMQWDVLWSSEDPKYGGSGRRPLSFHQRWLFSADVAMVLAPVKAEPVTKRNHDELMQWQARISFDPRPRR